MHLSGPGTRAATANALDACTPNGANPKGGQSGNMPVSASHILSRPYAPNPAQSQPSSNSYGPPRPLAISDADAVQPVEFAGVVERHLMSRLSSIIKSARDRGDQESQKRGPIVNSNMGPPGQSQRSRPSTVWEEGARAEI